MCIRSSSHTPVCFAPGLQETSHREGGKRWLSIHQPSSECSVWACCDGRRAGTELPKPLSIFPDVIIPPTLFLSETEDYLFPPPLKFFFFFSFFPLLGVAEKHDGQWRMIFAPWSYRFLFFKKKKRKRKKEWKKPKRSRCEIFHWLFFSCVSVLRPPVRT